MRTHKRLIVTGFVVLAMLLLFAAPVAAQATITKITGTERCTTTDPGTWTFLPDGGVHIRGMLQLCTETSSDPRGAGTNHVIVNANWSSDFTGPMWGTWHLDSLDGGTWEGTWHGMKSAGSSEIRAVGSGQGIDAGLEQKIHSINRVWTGRILDPHGD